MGSFITVFKKTHSCDVCLHRQQVKEGKELNCEDGVDLCGRQHEHSQRQQHLGITFQPAALLTINTYCPLLAPWTRGVIFTPTKHTFSSKKIKKKNVCICI